MIKGLKDLLDVKIMLIAAAFFTVFTFLSTQVYVNSKVLTGAVFTEGIEGPCVDKNGDLYLVNFHHEGSIGIIKSTSTIYRFARRKYWKWYSIQCKK